MHLTMLFANWIPLCRRRMSRSTSFIKKHTTDMIKGKFQWILPLCMKTLSNWVTCPSNGSFSPTTSPYWSTESEYRLMIIVLTFQTLLWKISLTLAHGLCMCSVSWWSCLSSLYSWCAIAHCWPHVWTPRLQKDRRWLTSETKVSDITMTS